MKAVFADSLYWIAIVRPNDPWKAAAKKARKLLSKAQLVTTDEVLVECLAALSGGGRIFGSKLQKWLEQFSLLPTSKLFPNHESHSFMDSTCTSAALTKVIA